MNKELESGIDRLKIAKVCCEEMQLDPSCKLQVGFSEAEIDALLSALQQPKEASEDVSKGFWEDYKMYIQNYLSGKYIILKRQQEDR